MGIDEVHPSSLGASMVISGIPDFTHVPPSSRIQNINNGSTVCVDTENLPCIFSGRVVAEDVPGCSERAKTFKTAADGLRGVTAWVEREGKFSVGDEVKLFVPKQRPWKCSTNQTQSYNSTKESAERQQKWFKEKIFVFLCFVIVVVAFSFNSRQHPGTLKRPVPPRFDRQRMNVDW